MKTINADKLLGWIQEQKTLCPHTASGFHTSEVLDLVKIKVESYFSESSETNLSKCCNAVVVASMGDEGTGCYVCSECNKPSDVIPFQMKTAEEIYVKWINDYNTGKHPDKTFQDISILAMKEFASQFKEVLPDVKITQKDFEDVMYYKREGGADYTEQEKAKECFDLCKSYTQQILNSIT